MQSKFTRRQILGALGGAAGATFIGSALKAAPALADGSPGGVYTSTNAAAGNAIVHLRRGPDGVLSMAGMVPTGGMGTGGGLGNAGALALSENGQWLIAVNAGSNDVSVFRVLGDKLQLTDRAGSGGQMPISVTIDRHIVYVLNDGGTANISGFILDPAGKLHSIAGSTRALSSAAPDAAQIGFRPDGRVLVVSEKATNMLTTYVVSRDGVAGSPNPQASHGVTPFGFAFSRRGRLFVSEAFGGAVDGSATSSYDVGDEGELILRDGSEPTTETAACWAAATEDGRFAYVANAGSGTVTGYRVSGDGSLTLLDADGATAGAAGRRPLDLALDRTSRLLYVMNAGTDGIAAYRLRHDGSLVEIAPMTAIPDNCNGLVAS